MMSLAVHCFDQSVLAFFFRVVGLLLQEHLWVQFYHVLDVNFVI